MTAGQGHPPGSPVIAAAAGGWTGGRLDRRVLLTAGMGVFVARMIVQPAGPDFAAVAIGRVLAALGAAAYQATAYSTAGILSDDSRRAQSLAVVAGGSSVAIVAGLPFGILVGQTWGWRAAMWVLVGFAVVSAATVWLLPPARSPRLSLRERGMALTDRRVLGILAGTVTALTPVFLVIAYLPAIMRTSGAWIVVAMLGYGAGQVTGTVLVPASSAAAAPGPPCCAAPSASPARSTPPQSPRWPCSASSRASPSSPSSTGSSPPCPS